MQQLTYWLSLKPVASISAAVFYSALLALVVSPWLRNRILPLLALPEPSTKQSFAALDSFRGLAALLVAVTHLWQWPYPIFASTGVGWTRILSYGSKAVPMFVILSGFLIYRSVKGVTRREDLERYAVRRFLRVYPVYLITVLVAIFVGQTPINISNILADIFMLRCLDYPAFTNPPAWSLYIEVLFYAIIPAFVAICGKRIFIISIVSLSILLWSDYPAGREVGLWKFFLVGIIASELFDRMREKTGEGQAVSLFVIGISLLMLDFFGPRFDWASHIGLVPSNPDYYTVGLIMACALILLGALNSRYLNSFFSIRPLRILGAVSYSLFLWHPFFILAVFPALKFSQVGRIQAEFVGFPQAPMWYLPFVMIPGVLLLACFSFLLIERPFLLLRPKSTPVK
jgi:peptidoglycan/LPS O-acetylase OafA/YrhL